MPVCGVCTGSCSSRLPPLPPTVSAHEGVSSVWKPFLLHSSLPLVRVPSLFFCLCFVFFLSPYPGPWGVSCLLGGLRSFASIQWVFYRSSSTCRYISDVSVGRKVISTSYSSGIFSWVHRLVFLLVWVTIWNLTELSWENIGFWFFR